LWLLETLGCIQLGASPIWLPSKLLVQRVTQQTSDNPTTTKFRNFAMIFWTRRIISPESISTAAESPAPYLQQAAIRFTLHCSQKFSSSCTLRGAVLTSAAQCIKVQVNGVAR